MKIGIMADIHGNLHALTRVLEAFDAQEVNVILCAGDLVCYGAYPNEVLNLLRRRGITSVIGNYGAAVAWDYPSASRYPSSPATEPLKRHALAWTKQHISPENLRYLQALPRMFDYRQNGLRIRVLHASPDYLDETISPEQPEDLEDLAIRLPADVIVLGHTHHAYVHACDRSFLSNGWLPIGSDGASIEQTSLNGGWHNQTLFINPGAVGRSLDGDTQAAYAILDTDTGDVSLQRVGYDVAAAAQAIAESGMPSSIAALVRHGVRRIEQVMVA
jgi:putative phosphoesterase